MKLIQMGRFWLSIETASFSLLPRRYVRESYSRLAVADLHWFGLYVQVGLDSPEETDDPEGAKP